MSSIRVVSCINRRAAFCTESCLRVVLCLLLDICLVVCCSNRVGLHALGDLPYGDQEEPR